ncbi:MAG: hypothetical protein HQL70_11735 [Magnetococcales bacterium]|nr:hypothetical protein [Magnetococcales bacterium]
MSSLTRTTKRNKVQQQLKLFPSQARPAIKALKGLKASGDQLSALCPEHGDEKHSLSISIGKDGKILLHCHAGCKTTAVLAKMDLKPKDLFPNTHQSIGYNYQDADGNTVFQMRRGMNKVFSVRRPDPDQEDGWINGIKGVDKVLFQFPNILKAIEKNKPIIMVEGEKDVLTLAALNLYATTNPFGAGPGKWLEQYTISLRGANSVMIVPDNDEPGRKHALVIAAALHNAGIRVKIINLPGLAKHEDVTDWMEAGGTRSEFIELIKGAPWWKPSKGNLFDPKAKQIASTDSKDCSLDLTDADTQELSPADAMIPVLNEKFAAVMINGSFQIMEPDNIDPATGYNRIIFYAASALEKLYGNQSVSICARDDKKLINPITYWMTHTARRTYLGIVFVPTGVVPDDYYNTWQGYAVTSKKGSIRLFLRHVKMVIANGDDEVYQYIIGFLADAVQMPEQRPGVVLALLGQQGTGKGIFVQYVGRIFGRHFLHVSKSSQFTGKFNSHLMEAALLFLDEAFWAGDKASEGTFKAMVTEPTMMVEQKYMNPIAIRNHLRIIMASNSSWMAPAGLEDRRVFAVEVSAKKRGNRAYFRALADEMENGGVEALLGYLLAYDLSEIDIRDFPRTDALKEQKIHSMSQVDQFWLSRLESGFLLEDLSVWGDGSVSTKAFYEEFLEHFKAPGNRWLASAQVFGSELRKVVDGMDKKRIGKENHYVFPALDVCREQWTNRTQQDWNWPAEQQESKSGWFSGLLDNAEDDELVL